MAVADWSPTKRQRLLINSHLLPLGITFPYGIRCGSDKEPGKKAIIQCQWFGRHDLGVDAATGVMLTGAKSK